MSDTKEPVPIMPQPAAPAPATAPGARERGFSLLVALMVMALLTTLGLTLMFTSETERAISRNFSGTIQAGYAAEAMADAAVQAFVFDLKNDRVGGWANKYLVVCDSADKATCLSRYGFDPTLAPCYNTGTPTSGCVWADTNGALTGSTGNWVADLSWRPSGTRPNFPAEVPMRLHPDLKYVMPWWKKFNMPIDPKNPSDPDALNTGAASIAVASVCSRNCTAPSLDPDDGDFDKKQILVTGIGQSSTRLHARMTKTKNPATRAITVRVLGELLGIWGNALVAGDGGGQTKVVEGDYLIRGGTLMFNSDPSKIVLAFNSANTGIVNNYYDDDSVPAIADWWWAAARNCGADDCDANNTADSAHDSDSNAATATVEPIARHLPDPPDLDTTDNDPGGYRPADTEAYPGPEGLEAKVRLRKGIIEIGSASAGIGRIETLEGAAAKPGHYWDNVLDLYMNETGIQQAGEITGANDDEVYRNRGADWDLRVKSGAFDIDSDSFKFPSLTDAYIEPLTREQYTNYYDFLRPASPTSAHPGGWGLDLSDIDGNHGLTRDITSTELTGDDCWPRANAPTIADVQAAFDGSLLASNTACVYDVDPSKDSAADHCGLSFSGCSSADTACLVTMTKTAGPPSPACEDTITFKIFRRKITGAVAADATLNLDTSSSIDAPSGRAQATMFDSFAYKLYVDVLKDIDNCSAPQSKIYENNLASLPAAFNLKIPDVYQGLGSTTATTCSQQQGPCFQERGAYMDVHIQLTDAPYWRLVNPFPPAVYAREYKAGGRWLSLRYRPSGNPDGLPVMDVLNDPRAGHDCGGGTFVHAKTDIAAEVRENGTAADSPFIAPAINSFPVPPGYDRAFPTTKDDALYRNMPTGAFVVALHLPCTDVLDSSNRNPYKCSQSDTPGYVAPSPSYPAYYTHILAWAPKYSCWRSTMATWDTTAANTPPSISPGNCGTAECGDSTISWFAQSMWQANATTLYNNPPVIKKGTTDTGNPIPGYEYSGPQGFLGYKLNVPYNSLPGTLSDDIGPCDIGLDRRMEVGASDLCSGAGAPFLKVTSCGKNVDGLPCNGTVALAAGCQNGATAADCLLNGCQEEADGTKYWNSSSSTWDRRAYGGCTEIFSPIVSLRNANLDPDDPLWERKTDGTNRSHCSTGGFGACTWTAHQEIASCTTEDTFSAAYYRGIDPDQLSSWWDATTGTPNRYRRAWPGWSSIAVLEGAGLVFTRDTVRLGSPKKTCDNLICNSPSTALASYNSAAPISATGAVRGFYSDPIVFDGRLILYAGTDTPATGTTKVFYHDHVLPRGSFGCSDFLTLLSNGDTEIDMQMPYDAGPTPRHLLASYSLSQGILKVPTDDTLGVSTELVGSWIANGADFGDRSSSGLPVQIIGTPTVNSSECDHPYLPGRDPFPQRSYMSYVEDETVSSGL